MNDYIFRLGKTYSTANNVVTNGDFSGGAAGWTLGARLSLFGGGVLFIDVGAPYTAADYTLSQAAILQKGVQYHLEFDFKRSGVLNPQQIFFSLGDYANYVPNTTALTTYTTYVHEATCISGTALKFLSNQGIVDNIKCYPMFYNNPLNYDPIGWDEAKITKKKDDTLNGLIIEYIADLTFIEDGYDYLYSQISAQGQAAKVPILIQKWNDILMQYENFFEGYIYLADCDFNITKKQVKCNVKDKNATQIFVTGKDVRVPLFGSSSILYNGTTPFSVPSNLPIDYFDAGGVLIYNNYNSADIYNLFRQIIMISTNYTLDCDALPFNSGTLDNLVLISGAGLRAVAIDAEATKVSFKQLFDELDKICDLAFYITTSSGIPVVTIDYKQNLYNAVPVLTLDRVNEISFTSNIKEFVKTVNIGYKYTDATATGTKETPNGFQYITENTSSPNSLNLVSEFIQSSDVILALLAGTITTNKYDNKLAVVETNGVNAINGSTGYNSDIDQDDNIVRWANSIQSNVLRLERDVNPIIITKTNTPLTRIYSFSYPLSKAQFDLITNSLTSIAFNTDGTGATQKVGYIINADFDVKTGLTDFKLLSN